VPSTQADSTLVRPVAKLPNLHLGSLCPNGSSKDPFGCTAHSWNTDLWNTDLWHHPGGTTQGGTTQGHHPGARRTRGTQTSGTTPGGRDAHPILGCKRRLRPRCDRAHRLTQLLYTGKGDYPYYECYSGWKPTRPWGVGGCGFGTHPRHRCTASPRLGRQAPPAAARWSPLLAILNRSRADDSGSPTGPCWSMSAQTHRRGRIMRP
jgi:hypothetical protein